MMTAQIRQQAAAWLQNYPTDDCTIQHYLFKSHKKHSKFIFMSRMTASVFIL